ncbi:hypothetical protein [Novipirellula aureliae]|uniref:hypothetical protein n=1 Tax=Novipirellula aureliae TaxID=2527966 RepID=UPI0018CF3A39|nr:hypothetical protein [Novipirellula aureliae]
MNRNDCETTGFHVSDNQSPVQRWADQNDPTLASKATFVSLVQDAPPSDHACCFATA